MPLCTNLDAVLLPRFVTKHNQSDHHQDVENAERKDREPFRTPNLRQNGKVVTRVIRDGVRSFETLGTDLGRILARQTATGHHGCFYLTNGSFMATTGTFGGRKFQLTQLQRT